MISYGRQDITADDIEKIILVLKSDYLTQGPAIPAFESAVATQVGAKHGVAFCNATAALHGAYSALGIGPESLVWTTPITFVATANAARMLGAEVDFVDTCPKTNNMSVKELAKKLKGAKAAGKLPDLVVPVHFSGQSCDMEAISALSKEYGFRIVEDASHGIGGNYKGEPIGGNKYSDITIFSFHPVKIITTGEGGMAMTNNSAFADAMNLFRSHGITRDVDKLHKKSEGGWYYEMLSLGFNYRMTDVLAALGQSQLSRLEDKVTRRHEIAAHYDKSFANLSIDLPFQESWQYSGYHLYVIGWPDGVGGLNREQAFVELRKAGIGVNVHYIPVHLQPYYQDLGFSAGDFPNAERYYAKAITLPLHPLLSDEEIESVVSAVQKLAN